MAGEDARSSARSQPSTKGQHILNKVYEHLNLLEKDYFGLRYVDTSNQTHWLDSVKSLRSQFNDVSPPYTLYFGVKFYAADPCKLHEEITRYQFFLQLKKDVLQGRLPVLFDTSAELGAFAVQSELGDFDPKRHYYGYVSELRFVPNQTEELEDKIMRTHRSLAGQVPSVAEFMYLDKIKWLDMYGVDLHPVQGEGNIEYFLGLTPTGIVVYKNKTRVGNYFWPRITKITFKGKTFMIRVRDKNNDENTYAFELAAKMACKHLWKCCVEHHAFFRLSQASENANSGKIFSFGSKYRYSGRTEKEAQLRQQSRQQPKVLRAPSKRYERRASSDKKPGHNRPPTEGKEIEQQIAPVASPDEIDLSNVQTPKTKRQSGYLASPESPTTSIRSAPWTSPQQATGGLYTSGKHSPVSTRSEKMKFPSHRTRTKSGGEVSGNESEYKRRSHHRSKYSDNESEISTTLRHRRRNYDSGSETDASRRSHRNRGRQRRSAVGSDWKRSDYNKENGSVISGHGSDSGQVQRRRRKRSRSRSPGKKPPTELQNHIKYDLVDNSGLSEEQMRDIPFTNVETNNSNLWTGKYSPYARHRRRSPARRRSFGSEASSKGPNGHGPPPYKARDTMVQPVPTVYQQVYQTASTVKTKPISTYIGSSVPPDAQPSPYTKTSHVNGYAESPQTYLADSEVTSQDSGVLHDHQVGALLQRINPTVLILSGPKEIDTPTSPSVLSFSEEEYVTLRKPPVKEYKYSEGQLRKDYNHINFKQNGDYYLEDRIQSINYISPSEVNEMQVMTSSSSSSSPFHQVKYQAYQTGAGALDNIQHDHMQRIKNGASFNLPSSETKHTLNSSTFSDDVQSKPVCSKEENFCKANISKPKGRTFGVFYTAANIEPASGRMTYYHSVVPSVGSSRTTFPAAWMHEKTVSPVERKNPTAALNSYKVVYKPPAVQMICSSPRLPDSPGIPQITITQPSTCNSQESLNHEQPGKASCMKTVNEIKLDSQETEQCVVSDQDKLNKQQKSMSSPPRENTNKMVYSEKSLYCQGNTNNNSVTYTESCTFFKPDGSFCTKDLTKSELIEVVSQMPGQHKEVLTDL